MRKIIIIIVMLFIPQIVFADVSEYINSFLENFENESYRMYSDILKAGTQMSDVEKQLILDKEISEELNTPFLYSDLENCIKIALEKNYEIRINDAYKKQQYWLYKNSQFQLLPNLYYNYDIKKLEGRYLVGGIVATTTSEIPIQSLVILEWSTINQGKYFFLLSQTKNMFKASVFNLEFSKEEIIKNTVLAYYDTLEKKLEMEVQKINLYDRLEQLKYTKTRFDSGLGTLYDVKRAQAEVAGAQQDYTTTLNALRLNQAALANIIGIEILDGIYPFETGVDQRALINPDCSIDELYKQALMSREDIKAKKAEINAYKAQRNSNYSDIIPAITFSYQNGLVGTKRSGMSDHNSITFDLKLPFGQNLYMGTITKIKSDTALVKAKKLELINLERQIKENILSYYYDSINSLKKIQAAKIEVEAANVSLDLSLANMKAGDATFIDVIASQNLKVQSNINLIKNMIEYNRAQTNLLFEVGILSPKNVLRGYKSKFY